MSLGIQISLKDDRDISATLQRVAHGLAPEQLNPIVGRSARNVYVDHLRKTNTAKPNQLGGKRTNFYLQAARGTQFRVVPDGVMISINQVGIAQRFFGGTIKPRTAKYLTLPVHPAAHGHRASEFDLELVFGQGGQPIALATKDSRGVSIKQTKTGRVTKKQTGQRGEIYFRLVKSVTQQADPSVLPTKDEVYENVGAELTSYANRLTARRGGNA